MAQVGGAAENLYNSAMVCRLEITHVAQEKVIFVNDFRVSGAPVGGGAIDASRGTVDSTVRDSYLTRLRGALECCASAGAAADLVGLRPFRREAR